jgi:hypothetical protein
MRVWLAMGLMTGLAACAVPPEMDVAAPEGVVLSEIQTPAPPPGARRVDEFDTTTQAQRSAALETSEGGVLIPGGLVSGSRPLWSRRLGRAVSRFVRVTKALKWRFCRGPEADEFRWRLCDCSRCL